MKRFAASFLTILLLFLSLSGCNSTSSATFLDGTYRAETSAQDTWGYRPYLIVTVQDGDVTEIEYDAVAEDGTLKSKDAALQSEMESVQGTYPDRYNSDLENQYMEHQNIENVELVAGATESSHAFKALFEALIPHMRAGDTTTLIV